MNNTINLDAFIRLLDWQVGALIKRLRSRLAHWLTLRANPPGRGRLPTMNKSLDLDAFIRLLDGQVDEGDNGAFYIDEQGIRAIVPDVSERQAIGLFSAEQAAIREQVRDCLLAFPCTIDEALAWIERMGFEPPDGLAERKAFAAEVGRICTSLFDLSSDSDLSKLDGKWLVDVGDKSGQSRSTMNNWWKSFCQATGREMTPKQAAAEDKAAFFDWLEEAKAKAERAEADQVAPPTKKKPGTKAEPKNIRAYEYAEQLIANGTQQTKATIEAAEKFGANRETIERQLRRRTKKPINTIYRPDKPDKPDN